VRILHGECKRGAGLIAVERAVAGGIEPERGIALPVWQRIGRLAGASALIAAAARPIILCGRRSEIVAEAEAFIRECNRAIRIAFAGGDAVAEAGDEISRTLISVAIRCGASARWTRRRWRPSGDRSGREG